MHALTDSILSLQRRLAWRRRATALCLIAATVLAAALLLGLADYVVRFTDPGLRIMATATLLAAMAWATYRWWYLPGRHRLGPLVVARRIENRFPQLRDSLASAVEFLHQPEEDPTAGSAVLRRHVVAEAQTAVDRLPLEEVIDRRPFRRAAVCLAVVAFPIVLLAALDARAVSTAALRLAAPLGGTEWPRQHHLAFRNPPAQLAAGQSFEVELIDTTGTLPDEVRIEYRMDRGGHRERLSEPMTRVGNVMVARRDNIRQSFSFRATGGDDYTMPWHHVEVVEPPRLESMSITVHPPAYTGRPPRPAERHLDVLAGSGIEVRGSASEPLSAARILLNSGEPIKAKSDADPAGRPRRAFHVTPNQWVAAKSGPYRLELADAEGVDGIVGQWNLRVQPDAPPSVSWQRPSDDLFVLANAQIPIEVLVKDDLAIAKVELVYQRSDRSEAERVREPDEPRIELYLGPEQAARANETQTSNAGESRVVEYQWALAALRLPAGSQLTAHAEAADYRPGVGRTVATRRITIITDDELEARFAERLAQIVRHLERGLSAQRATRADVQRLEIQQRDAGALSPDTRNAIQAAEFNQRRVGAILVEPDEGVPAHVGALLAEIEMNRLPSTATTQTLEKLRGELDHVAAGPLDSAERELTTARKAAEVADARLLQSLTSAGAAQDEVIATIEHLIGEIAGRADLRQLTRQLAELRQDQIGHERQTRAEIGLATLPLELDELSRSQRGSLKAAAAGQEELARRFDKIERGMDSLAQELADEDNAAAGKLADAVALARRLAIATDMQAAARELAENRVNQAIAGEQQIAEELQQVLDVLRDRREPAGDQFVDWLREAEKRLATLREQLAELRQRIARVEAVGVAADARQLAQLHAGQETLRFEIAQLARELDRLQAADAGQSARSAAGRLDRRSPEESQNAAPIERPSPSHQVQKAEEDLEDAARQLAQRRQQAEDDLALEFVRRFQAELGEMVTQQRRVIARTAELDSQRPRDGQLREDQSRSITELALKEQQLAQLAREHSELLVGLGAVRISLEDAERRLSRAAELLADRLTGATTQQAEKHALDRLESMLKTFEQTAEEATPNRSQATPPAAGAGANGQQRRPTFELLEVKMLRMLQADLNERTREFEARLTSREEAAGQNWQADREREAQELSAEQRRLAELVQEMLARNNEQQQ